MGSLTPYLSLARPVTLLPVLVIAVIFGLLPVGGHVTVYQFAELVIAGMVLTAGNFGSNVFDQIAGQIEDSVHPTKQSRPVVAGEVSPMAALSIAVGGWLVAAVVAAAFLPKAFLVIYLAILLFALTYVYPPGAKKRTFPTGLAWIAVPRGALGIAAAWSIFGSVTDPHLWLVLVLTIPYVFFGNAAKDIDDVESDLEAENQTPATLFGETFCRGFAFVGFLWLPIGTALFGIWRWDPFLVGTLAITLAGTAGALRWSGERFWRVGFYGGYMLLALLFGLPMLFGHL